MSGKLIGWAVFIAIAVVLFMGLNKGTTQYADIALSDFYNLLARDQVERVEVRNDELYGELKSPQDLGKGRLEKFQVALPPGTTAGWTFTHWLLESRGTARVQVWRGSTVLNMLLPLIPWLLIFGFIWFFMFRQLRQQTRKEPLKVFVVNQAGAEPPASPPAT